MEDQKLSILQVVFGTALIIMILVCFIITTLYFYQKKQFHYQKQMDDLRICFEKDILQSRLEVQEETFQNISREIHDNIVSSLALAKLNLHNTSAVPSVLNREKIICSIQLIENVIQSLRNLSKGLHSDIIKETGLFYAIENEVAIIRKAGQFRIFYIISGEPIEIHPDKALIIFRIIQECLTNIIKHSGASEIRLELHFNERTMEVSIKDNGNGFSLVKSGNNVMSAGLKNIQQRTGLLKGELVVTSSIGEGTEVNITIPFTNQIKTINNEY